MSALLALGAVGAIAALTATGSAGSRAEIEPQLPVPGWRCVQRHH